jgi:hypothetical protein
MSISSRQLKAEPLNQDALGSDPTVGAGQGTFFAKTVLGVPEAFFKNGNGHVIQLTSGGELIGGAAFFEKSFVNGAGAPMIVNELISLATDGSIVEADSDSAQGQRPIGFLKAATAFPGNGKVIMFGRNLAGVLAGLGFAPGDDIYMSETAGQLTNDPNTFTGGNDTIVRLGIACMAENTTGSLATDLILMREILITA